MRLLVAPLLAIVLCCGGPTRVRIAEADGPADVLLPTLSDLGTVTGDVAELFGGARIRFDRVAEATDRGANRELLVAHPRAVRTQYVVNADQVAVATDFDTLVMFSTYAHLERAALAFRALDVVVASTPVPVYYAPVVEGGLLPSTDAAAYFAGVDFFVVTRAETVSGVPLGANPGVAAHETSHRVWYYELWRARLLERLPAILDDPEQSADFNLLRAADEGVADYFGAAVSGDPTFVGDSFDAAEHRYLDRHYDVVDSWTAGIEPTLAGRYDPYPLGSVLASTLWRIHDDTDALDLAVIDSQRALGSRLLSDFVYELGDFEIELLRQLDGGARVDACDHFEDSYVVVWHRFTSVCP